MAIAGNLVRDYDLNGVEFDFIRNRLPNNLKVMALKETDSYYILHLFPKNITAFYERGAFVKSIRSGKLRLVGEEDALNEFEKIILDLKFSFSLNSF